MVPVGLRSGELEWSDRNKTIEGDEIRKGRGPDLVGLCGSESLECDRNHWRSQGFNRVSWLVC